MEEDNNECIQRSQVVSLHSSQKQFKEQVQVQKTTQPQSTIESQQENEDVLQKIKSYKPKNSQYSYENLSKLHNFCIRRSQDRAYFGQSFNKMKQGKGVILYDNGRFYEGVFENDRKHGQGFETFSSGAVYSGNYMNSKPHGFGKYIWGNGEIYEGEWVNGTKHGNGMWVGLKGDKYIGEWNQGRPHGKGIHSWVNGDRYEGDFSDCLKQGWGYEQFANGDTYEGYYCNGKPEGEGKYKWKDGAQFKGTFRNGLRCGYGVYTGPRYDFKGEYINDRKNGFGEFIYKDGRVFKGTFYEDQKDGDGLLELPDGTQIPQKWKIGQLVQDFENQPSHQFVERGKIQKISTVLSSYSQKQLVLQSNSQSDLLNETQQNLKEIKNNNGRYPIQSIGKPPSSSHHSSITNRTTRIIKNDFKLPINSVDYQMFTTSSSFAQNGFNQQKIPQILQRPRQSVSKDVTPEKKKKDISPNLPKPQFTLRFATDDKNTYKTSTGLTGFRRKTLTAQKSDKLNKTICYEKKQTSTNKVQDTIPIRVRIRSISGMKQQTRMSTQKDGSS